MVTGCVLLGMLAAVPPTAHAAFPGQNGKIALEISGDIYSFDADGTGLTRLTDHPGEDRVPNWSPEGTRIAFASFRGGLWGIYVMDADGSDVALVTEEPGFTFSPSWSPDATKLAYQSSQGGVRVVNLDGTGRTDLHGGIDPAWSPDGSLIAYWTSLSGIPRTDVFTMRPDGTGNFNVTNDASTQDHSPDWSPDSQKILFFRDNVIHTIRPDGTGLTPIVPGIVPKFSPDGTKIVYVELNSRRIATANADGSGVQVISGQGYNPDWQPIPGPQRSDYKNAAQFCKADREFLGEAGFRQKYGGGANAHGKCVSGS